jgi:hypothetical protein
MFVSGTFLCRLAGKVQQYLSRRLAMPVAALVVALGAVASPLANAAPTQKTFATPEAAAAALADAARSGSQKRLRALLGPAGSKLGNNDPALARAERKTFVDAYNEKHSIALSGDARATLVVGSNDWPFPLPLVKGGKGWYFDAAAGAEEIANRRIGRNELHAIQTLLAIVDAQREYAAEDRDGDGLRDYAQKFASTPGKRDGLYWPVGQGGDPSPLGALVASAVEQGFVPGSGAPRPYWGYYFRILTEQGSGARGGAYSYLAGANLIGGFAVIAYPAEYGESGVKSFLVNHDGIVFEKDLGADTHAVAAATKAFDPGSGWQEVAR